MTSAGITVRAVSLVESGVLVNGMTVTDLLSGFTIRAESDRTGEVVPDTELVTGPGTGSVPLDAEEGDGLMWRRSTVPIRRLEAIRELIAEVMDARAKDPELTSPNPRRPRTLFPWGVGERRSDVVVTGPDAGIVAAYLRSAGVRARCVDHDAALRIAADLELARAELADLERGEGVAEVSEQRRSGRQTCSVLRQLIRGRYSGSIVVIGAVVLVSVLATFIVPGFGGEGSGGASSGSTGSSVDTGSTSSSEATEYSAMPWSEPLLRGSSTVGADPVTARAAIPVNTAVQGWILYEATERREIWVSQDPGVRILVAATPAPLSSQEELDARVLAVLGKSSEIRVISSAPVDYEETNPGSVTRWQIRLIDHHQVSVGCQYRRDSGELMMQRLAACDRFTASARVG